MQPQFEMNPAHPIIKKLNSLRESNPQLAILVTEQLFANAMVSISSVLPDFFTFSFPTGVCRVSGGSQDNVEVDELTSRASS